jgi:MerR family transcriptional regulator, light-induced transcriptional regulator
MYDVVVTASDPQPSLRIGELSRRLGVSDHALRAWERRYGLLRPVRTTGGFRLYSEADLQRVTRMQAHLARGMSTAEAARAAIEEEANSAAPDTGGGDHGDTVSHAIHALTRALDEFDEPTAQTLIDNLLSTLTVETVLREVLLPYLRDLGERWEGGTASIAQEHFASNVIRGRLSSVARGWGHGGGPRVLLACVPGELHDIGLLAFGIVLSRRGWRIQYLGPDTPVDELVRVANARYSDLIVLVSSTSERFDDAKQGLSRLARLAPLAIAGSGATEAIARAVGAKLLSGDPVTAAESTAATHDDRTRQ